MKSFKTFLKDEYDQYLNNQYDKYTWNPEDIHVDANYTQSYVGESTEDHEEWLGTDNVHEKLPTAFSDISKHLNNHIDSTKKLYKGAGLLTRESEALNHYIGSGYVEMNHLNRHGTLPTSHPNNPDLIDKLNNHNNKLDSGIKRQITEHPIHVYRGMGGAASDRLNLNPGDTFHDKGFVSTSTHPRIAKLFSRNFDDETGDVKNEIQHVAHIKIPKGSSAIHALTHNKTASRSENEILLPRNSRFRYDGHTEHEDPDNSYYNPSGKFIVHHLTHIPEGSND